MIHLTRLDGSGIMLNAEWIQSVEDTPDTLITMTTGFKLIVREPVAEVVKLFTDYQKTKFSDVLKLNVHSNKGAA